MMITEQNAYVLRGCGKLLSVAAAAHALGVKPRTLRAWIRQGKVTNIRLGRCLRISEHELARLVREGFRQSRI